MKTFLLVILINLLLTNCSSLHHKRHPANEDIVQSKDEILQVFEFHLSKISNAEKDYKTIILNYIKDTTLFQGTYGTGNEIAVEFIEDTSLPKGVAYFPEFQAKENTYKIVILHSPEGIHDPLSSAELMNFLRTLKNQKYFMSHFSAFEMYYNLLEQDPIASQNWAKIREFSAKLEPINEFNDAETMAGLQNRAEEWGKEKGDYLEKAEQKLKLERKQDKERRIIIDALDKATDDLQFKNLVAQNDRKGVSNLLNKYLPWEQMAPFEKKYWETYLDNLQNPLPIDQRIFIYRGIQDDFVYSAYREGKELNKEVAQKEGNIFVMSTMMTKNQGTWNRRLRSLTTMNEKFIGTNANLEDEFTKSARIITMFVNHSKNPLGSPFLSFTPKFRTAKFFGAHKMSAYVLDPRLVSFNFSSQYKHEVEFLLPLTVFPEDVVAFYDDKIHTDVTNTEEQMEKLFKEKLTKTYGQQKGETIFQNILKNSTEYFDSALNRYEGKMTAAVAVSPSPNPNFLVKFFNNIFTKEPQPNPIEILPIKNSSCIDIMSSFWK